METANSVITDIFQEMTVSASEQEIQSVDFQTAVRYVNRFMAELDAMGTKLGWTNIANASDNITIPAGAVNGLIYNVAMNLCTSYDITVTQELYSKAKSSLNVMNTIGNPPPSQKYPSTMPTGSGNNEWINDSIFFSGCCEDNPSTCESN